MGEMRSGYCEGVGSLIILVFKVLNIFCEIPTGQPLRGVEYT